MQRLLAQGCGHYNTTFDRRLSGEVRAKTSARASSLSGRWTETSQVRRGKAAVSNYRCRIAIGQHFSSDEGHCSNSSGASENIAQGQYGATRGQCIQCIVGGGTLQQL